MNKSAIYGLIAGLIAGCQGTVRASGMYSYNGAVLPALPEWDKAAYPYAYIGTIPSAVAEIDGKTFLYVAKEQYHCEEGSYGVTVIVTLSHLYGKVYWVSGNAWEEKSVGAFALYPIWSNTDLTYEDGTVHISGSEPIPL